VLGLLKAKLVCEILEDRLLNATVVELHNHCLQRNCLLDCVINATVVTVVELTQPPSTEEVSSLQSISAAKLIII
jgi:hypothetical protein